MSTRQRTLSLHYGASAQLSKVKATYDAVQQEGWRVKRLQDEFGGLAEADIPTFKVYIYRSLIGPACRLDAAQTLKSFYYYL